MIQPRFQRRRRKQILIAAGILTGFVGGLLITLKNSAFVPAATVPALLNIRGAQMAFRLPAGAPIVERPRANPISGKSPALNEFSTIENLPRLPAPASPAERHANLAAALKERSAVTPVAAAEQWLALHPADRVLAVRATLVDAASRSPDEAVNEAIRFCDEDPSYAVEYGRALIAVLAKTNDYRSALRFVLAEESDGWLGENGHKWFNTLFTNWAEAAPMEAVEAAQHVVGPAWRGEALQLIATAWAKTDPVAAVKFALQLPVVAERTLTLDAALRGQGR